MARVMTVFGTGGHSTEMLMLMQNSKLIQKVNNGKISYLTCVVSEDDRLVINKLCHEKGKCHRGSNIEMISLNRARRVGQTFLSAIWTTLISLLGALEIVVHHKPHICLTNGPGISVTVLIAIRFLQAVTFLTGYRCLVIYIESFCRTRTLSLSGKIVYHLRLADKFYVQWPFLHEEYPRTSFEGIIV